MRKGVVALRISFKGDSVVVQALSASPRGSRYALPVRGGRQEFEDKESRRSALKEAVAAELGATLE